MDKLQRFLEERRRAGKPSDSFEEFEEQLHRLMSEVETEAVGEELGRHDVDRATVVIDGVEHRRVVRCEQEYFTPALRGFRQHFPREFDQLLGTAGQAAISRLEAPPLDANRYLKLRRIAIERLAKLT